MAYIRRQRNKWRAEIERLGVRKSRTFPTREDAEQWAASAEPRVVARAQRKAALHDATLRGLMPRRVLDALNSTDYTQDEILEAATHCGTHCGVYFLICRDEVVYVGQSIDVFTRISKHRRAGYEFDAFTFLACPADELASTEAAYITAFLPHRNRALGQVSTPAP